MCYLPAQLGGLGIRLPLYHADSEYQCSESITRPLRDHILNQKENYSYDIWNEQMQNRAQVSRENRKRSQDEADSIYQQPLKKAMDLHGQAERSFILADSSPTVSDTA